MHNTELHHLPRGLLARASYQRYAWALNTDVAPEELAESGKQQALNDSSAQCIEQQSIYQAAVQDLQEVRDSAERSGMRLFLTDYHLEAARLALTVEQSVLAQTAAEHLQAAKQLITDTGISAACQKSPISNTSSITPSRVGSAHHSSRKSPTHLLIASLVIGGAHPTANICKPLSN